MKKLKRRKREKKEERENKKRKEKSRSNGTQYEVMVGHMDVDMDEGMDGAQTWAQ